MTFQSRVDAVCVTNAVNASARHCRVNRVREHDGGQWFAALFVPSLEPVDIDRIARDLIRQGT